MAEAVVDRFEVVEVEQMPQLSTTRTFQASSTTGSRQTTSQSAAPPNSKIGSGL
jgi:hypothetical protein